MKIGIVDADLIGRQKHRFPNLVCEKLSGYWKEQGAEVFLLTDYNSFDMFDKIYVSKVFTDTPVPEWLKETENVHIGGTGFYFDSAPDLPDEIEHHMPDYRLYDSWIKSEIEKAKTDAEDKDKKFNESSFLKKFNSYTDYSIGFLTRGCFRKCEFCVNKKYNHVFSHSPLEEFLDDKYKKICLLDDNFFGCPEWKRLFQQLLDTNKKFRFKQGLDERLLNEEKCEMLFSAPYDGDYTFAFDNIEDYDLIKSKLQIIRKYNKKKNVKFYVLTGFQSTDGQDIENAFKRISLLMEYNCLPYLMRYQNKNETPWKNSKYHSLYVTMARWCNQPSIFKKMSFRQFCEANQELHKTEGTLCASMQSMVSFEKEYPSIAKQYFDLRFEDFKL